mmetsp:Transcript_5821/g.19546  ORF Transcript_5821/g.19546 Transcript_5821/m.19546 type:complete len:96 (-) Transcript_5821:104-391(-)
MPHCAQGARPTAVLDASRDPIVGSFHELCVATVVMQIPHVFGDIMSLLEVDRSYTLAWDALRAYLNTFSVMVFFIKVMLVRERAKRITVVDTSPA